MQKLNESFFVDVVSYLKEKKILLDNKQDEDDLFAAGEREKLEYELRSIKRILKEVYEKREKKILDIALNKSRTGSDIIDTGAMLKEEKEFYDLILGLLDGYRKGILFKLFKGALPMIEVDKREVVESNKLSSDESVLDKGKITEKPIVEPETKEILESEPGENKELMEKEKKPELNKETLVKSTEQNPTMKKIKFIHPVPSFVWTDLKDYGPWEAGEETEIFAEVADLIIEKERAVEV